MVAVLEHFPAQEFQLCCNRHGIVVVESMAFGLYWQTERDRDAMLVSRVQQCLRVLLLLRRAPVSNRVSAGCRKALDVVNDHAGTLDRVRLATTQQLITAPRLDNLDLHGRDPCIGFRRAGNGDARDRDDR